MGLAETLTFYLLIGAAIAVAVYVTDDRRATVHGWFVCITSVLFWPLYLPLLIGRRTNEPQPVEPSVPSESDELAAAIAQVERELDAALFSLDGWAESALAFEANRIAELCQALRTQASRIREMDRLLSRTDPSDTVPQPKQATTLPADSSLERWHKSRQARANNLTRLAQVRRQSHADLMATLAWIRELVSMIHLAKFTGAPASRAEELVAQIAAAVEGVSAAAWQEADFQTEKPASSAATESMSRLLTNVSEYF